MSPSGRSLVARWAANGALTGAGSAGVLMWVDRLHIGELQNAVFYLLPGLAFGLVVAVQLGRRGLAGRRPAAIFVAASVVAWPAAYYAGGSLLLAIDANFVPRLGLAGFAGGLVWAAIPTAAAMAMPLMRVRRVWPLLVVAGAVTGALCVSLLETLGQWGFGAIYIVLWGVWYAVFGGVLATALPSEGVGE